MARLACVLSCLVMLGCSASSSEQEAADAVVAAPTDPVTLKNWSKHPRVVEIRQIVEGVEGDLAKQIFKLEKKDRLCAASGETIREKITDSSGQIRKLAIRGGGDDGAVIEAFYYQGGVLRFVYREHRAGTSVVREDRIYFDESGKRLFWALRSADVTGNPDKAVAPPKVDAQPYRVPSAEDEEDFELTPDLTRSPQKRFDAKPVCY